MPAMPPMQVHQAPGQGQMIPQAPSVWQKLQMGAMMGAGVGLSIGFIGGAFQILRAGPGPKGALATMSQFMGTSAATFAFFLSIGSVIRSDASLSPVEEARWRQAYQQGSLRVLADQRRQTLH
ncbi:hypothetical protein BCV69DRAFT_279741 [Microstroma glucosiphilum]|uniref:Uncharacterized protein n=1 Tax=Pseudomicrostroma glucosiphilum TaxID=1684307 RepID=A0A316UF11_9BASI|nr:hypothetical protein BCV69DRAFT_279741 [Pseudomicrostroma glucosiphilum]PWN23829.1 hypothetical protein BCV69DRAFT_279741 [Pseudomicrostroma glucosiphilum]